MDNTDRRGFILGRNRLMETTRIKRLFPSNNALFLLTFLRREKRKIERKKLCQVHDRAL